MTEDLQIVKLDNPAWEVIGQGITAYNTKQAGEDDGQNMCFVVQTFEGEIAGGIIGATYWEWLYVNLMWLREDLRHQGYGKELLSLAEDEARQRGAKQSYLDTFSFQAPGFYQKQGYEVFGQLDDFPPGQQRYFLKKKL